MEGLGDEATSVDSMESGTKSLRHLLQQAENDLERTFSQAHDDLCGLVEKALASEAGLGPDAGSPELAGARREALLLLSRSSLDPGGGHGGDPVGPLREASRTLESLLSQLAAEIQSTGEMDAGTISDLAAQLQHLSDPSLGMDEDDHARELAKALPDAMDLLERAIAGTAVIGKEDLERIQRLCHELHARRFAWELRQRTKLAETVQKAETAFHRAGEGEQLATAISAARQALGEGKLSSFQAAQQELAAALQDVESKEDRAWVALRDRFDVATRALAASDDAETGALAEIEKETARFQGAMSEDNRPPAESATDRLEGLLRARELETRRHRLEETAERIEALSEGQGRSQSPLMEQARDLLTRFQLCLEGSRETDTSTLLREAEDFLEDCGRGDTAPEAVEAAPLPTRQRQFNEKFHPRALERFDGAWSDWEVSRGTSREAAFRQSYLAARKSLLRPTSVLRRIAVAAAILLVTSGLSFALWTQNGAREIRQVVVMTWSAGSVQPAVRCDGEEFQTFETRAGQAWAVELPLAADDCEVSVGTSAWKSFPANQTVIWLDPPVQDNPWVPILEGLLQEDET